MTRFRFDRKPDGSAVLAWSDGACALHGLEVCDGVATVFVNEPLPPPAVQSRVRDDGTLEYGIPAELLECMTTMGEGFGLLFNSVEEDARRFRFCANAWISGRPMPDAFAIDFSAAKTIGDFRAAVDRAMASTDERIPNPERKP